MTPNLYDLNSAAGVRQIVAALFQGYNYRLYTEGQTRNQLLDAYRRLAAIRQRLPDFAGYEEWMAAIRAELNRGGNDLAWWLLGLAYKTARNLGISRDERPDYLEEIARHVQEAAENSPDWSFDDAMLMVWGRGRQLLRYVVPVNRPPGKGWSGRFCGPGWLFWGCKKERISGLICSAMRRWRGK